MFPLRTLRRFSSRKLVNQSKQVYTDDLQPSKPITKKLFSSKDTHYNWVGPPDPASNLRLLTYYKPENESRVEREFREARIEVQQWNQTFWEENNASFYKAREEFIAAKKNELFGNRDDKKHSTLPADEMAKFFKKFLDDKRIRHMQYNKEWYKKNIGLLIPALKVVLYKFWKRLN